MVRGKRSGETPASSHGERQANRHAHEKERQGEPESQEHRDWTCRQSEPGATSPPLPEPHAGKRVERADKNEGPAKQLEALDPELDDWAIERSKAPRCHRELAGSVEVPQGDQRSNPKADAQDDVIHRGQSDQERGSPSGLRLSLKTWLQAAPVPRGTARRPSSGLRAGGAAGRPVAPGASAGPPTRAAPAGPGSGRRRLPSARSRRQPGRRRSGRPG